MREMRKLISYPLNEKDPGWPGNPKIEIAPYTLISQGNGSNQYEVTLFNHFGSHMDAPRHFVEEGKCLVHLSLDYFFFDSPLLLDIPKTYSELVERSDLEAYQTEIQRADLLMIRSGFSKQRFEDPEGYSYRGPGFSSSAAQYLMDHFPHLRGIAMDWISLSSYSHRKEGGLAHRYVLGDFHDHHMVIIEDLNFEELNQEKLSKVIALPVLIQGVDSGPCTVVAEMKA